MAETLLQKAQRVKVRVAPSYVPSQQEEELFKAYLEGTVVAKQVEGAMEKGAGFTSGWTHRLIRHLYGKGRVIIKQ